MFNEGRKISATNYKRRSVADQALSGAALAKNALVSG
jgi:hypothetical protein